MSTAIFKDKNELLPAIIQDAQTKTVLMLGFMNAESLEITLAKKQVTFFSRSKNRLWTKGESSGNFLQYQSHEVDCDQDTILIQALPAGPVCHTGTKTCFNNANESPSFIHQLEKVLEQRSKADPKESYTAQLLASGINKVAQKVGEEAVELVIEAKDENKDLFLGEAADLMYHYLVLLRAKGIELKEVEAVLSARHK